MAVITDDESDALREENFDTTAIPRAVDAVDAVDEIRLNLKDGADGSPPSLRTDLLTLHRLAMIVINRGARSQVEDLFEAAVELEDHVFSLMNSLEQIQETLSSLTALYPESLAYGVINAQRANETVR